MSCPPKFLALFISCSLWQSSWNQRQIWSDSKFRFSYSAMPDTVFLHIWGGTRIFTCEVSTIPFQTWTSVCISCVYDGHIVHGGSDAFSELSLAYLWGEGGNLSLGTEGRHLVISGFSILCTYLDNSSRAYFLQHFYLEGIKLSRAHMDKVRFEVIRRCLEGRHMKNSSFMLMMGELWVTVWLEASGPLQHWFPWGLPGGVASVHCTVCPLYIFPLSFNSSCHSVIHVADVQVLRDWSWQRFPNPVLGNVHAHQLEKAMVPHSSTLAWKIPWMEEPGRLQSMGLRRVGHDWATLLSLFTFMHWRRKWQPTPVFLPGESQGRGSLVGCCLWGCIESDTTEAT